jgi:acyl-coenzyme A thioesterase PaaI-like protein
MRCEGRIIQVGNRIGTAEAKLVDQQGKIYAFGSSSCMILR